MKEKPFVIEEQSRSFSVRWQISLAFFAFIVIGAIDGAVGVLIPSISAHYGVDKALVSLLFLCSSAGYLITAFNSGFLVKKLEQRGFLLFGVSALIIAGCIITIMPPFAFLTLPFFLTGLGIADLDTGLNAYIASLPSRAALLNYLHAFYGTGALLGPIIVSTTLLIGLTWNYVYSLWLILGLFLFFGIILTFKKQAALSDTNLHRSPVQFSKRETRERSRIPRVRLVPLGQAQQLHASASESHLEIEAQNKKSSMATVLHLPVTWIVAFFLFFYVGAEISLGLWMYSFLTEQRHQPALFSAWIVSGYWIGFTLGRLVLAKLVNWLSERAAIQICVIGAMLGVLLAWLIPIGSVSILGLYLTGFCLGPIFPTTIALMPQFFSQRLLATAIGLVACLGGLGGTLFSWLSGNLAQAFGLWIILPNAIALTVMMFLLWILLQMQQASS